MSNGPSALVIVPTYNEAENVEALTESVLALRAYDLLIVDDNSPDGTGEIVDKLIARFPHQLHVLHRPGKSGLGTAYIEGFRYALDSGYQFIIEMDCDFSHDPRVLGELVDAARLHGVAIGSRYVRGGSTPSWPLHRRLVSRGGSMYARTVLGMRTRDLTSGYKCFRRDVLAQLDLDSIRSTGYSFQIEMNWRCSRLGFQPAEVPITFVDRRAGESKMSGAIFLEALTTVWKLRLSGARQPSVKA